MINLMTNICVFRSYFQFLSLAKPTVWDIAENNVKIVEKMCEITSCFFSEFELILISLRNIWDNGSQW